MTTSQRDKNRERYPELAKFMDEMRAEFGEVKIVSLTPGFKDLESRIPINKPVEVPSYLSMPEYDVGSNKLNAKERRTKEQLRLMAKMVRNGELVVGGKFK